MTGTSRDYTDRLVDLECLRTIAKPVGEVEVSLSSISGTTRRVTGMQKAIQRYVTLLLTPTASRLFPNSQGNQLYDSLRAGTVSDAGYLRHLFNVASIAAIDAINKDDYNTEKFGDIPDDERIATVELDGVTLDYQTSTVGLSLIFRTVAGSDYTYILPVSTEQR